MTSPRAIPSLAGVASVPGSGSAPRVRLSGPGAVVACLPQLIGFHPQESLVLVGLVPAAKGRPKSKRQLGLTLRIDLDAVIEMMKPVDVDHPQRLAGALERNGCVGALMVVVTDRVPTPPDRDHRGPITEVIDAVSAGLHRAGIDLSDVLLVTRGRWWSYLCRNPACCPPEGTAISRADSDLYTAELAWNGESAPVLSSRTALEARVAPDTSGLAREVAEEVDRIRSAGPRPAPEALGRIAELLQRFRTQDQDVAAEVWARVLVDLTDVLIRDGCLPTWKGPLGETALDLWCAATRVAPPGLVAPPATLVAVLAHAGGDGALASCALDRALGDDPTYRMARYANSLLGGGVPPTVMRRMLVETKSSMRSQNRPVLDRRGRLVFDRRSDDSVTPARSASQPASSDGSMDR